MGGAVIILRSRQRKTRSELDEDEQQRLNALLKSDRKP